MKVLLNGKDGKRVEVQATKIRENATSIRVRLPDGREILRKKERDIVKEDR